ncbi:hypothetical protein HC928_08175 [bacterium]|nr:hypothetical protein [bacterium]
MANKRELDTSSSRYAVFAAKIQVPPQQSRLLTRSRLLDKLTSLDGIKLVLVSAPVGFGKTTLISMAAHYHRWRTAWVSLDSGDNHPLRFWVAVLQALKHIHPAFHVPPINLLRQDSTPEKMPITARILVELEHIPHPHVIVLDDYHLIDNTAIHAEVSTLLEHLPRNSTLIVITRANPGWNLARMRVNGELLEIRERDLVFDPDEARDLLAETHGLALAPEDMKRLQARVEGWAARLQIAAHYLQRNPPAPHAIRKLSADQRHFTDYLTEEVLAGLPADVERFLAETSILGTLRADLCDAVTGRDDGQQMLGYLDQANLFITRLDERREWYRYYVLFADFLRRRLERMFSQDEIAVLHRRAWDWYARNGHHDQAIQHALTVGDYANAANCLAEAAGDLLLRGDITTLLSWFDLLPASLVDTRPELLILRMWASLFAGELDEVERLLARFDNLIETTGNPKTLRADVLALRSEVARLRGDLSLCVSYAQQAVQQLPEDNVILRGVVTLNLGYAEWFNGDLDTADHIFTHMISDQGTDEHLLIDVIALNNRAYLNTLRGDLRGAKTIYEGVLQRLSGRDPQVAPALGMTHLGLAELHYQWHQLDEALRLSQLGLREGESWIYVKYLLLGYFTYARTLHALKRYPGRDRVLLDVERLIHKANLVPLERQRLALQARFDLDEGRDEAARRWAIHSGIHEHGQSGFLDEFEALTLVRVWLAQGRTGEARELLTRLLRSAKKQKRLISEVEIHLLLARIAAARRDNDEATQSLHEALMRAEPERLMQVFIEQGPVIVDLLKRSQSSHGAMREFVQHLLDVFDNQANAPIVVKLDQAQVEPLTEREKDVLKLLAEGKSNPEIADHLDISPGTVGTHIKNILAKLRVRNRTEAITRAIQIGLLNVGKSHD